MEDQTLLPIIMIILLLVGCYFSVLRALMQRSNVQNAFPAVAGILLFIFILMGATLMILSTMMGADLVLLTLLIMISLITLCAAIGYLVQNYRSLHIGALALLFCYLLAVAYITLFSRSSVGDHRISLLRTDLFIMALQMHSLEPLRHVFLNLAMFIPIGFLLPPIQSQKRTSLSNVLFLSMTLSVLIETLQLLLQIGQADLTDVIANTLGGVAGFLIYCLLHRFAAAKDETDDYDN